MAATWYFKLVGVSWFLLVVIISECPVKGRTIDDILSEELDRASNGSRSDELSSPSRTSSRKSYLMQLDMLLTAGQWKRIKAANKRNINGTLSRQKRKGIKDSDSLWKEGKVPYEINKRDFKDKHKLLILEAINVWQRYTCVTFMEIKDRKKKKKRKNKKKTPGISFMKPTEGGKKRKNKKKTPGISFMKPTEGGCSSSVGQRYQKKPQDIKLGNKCLTIPIIVHEIGHALGLYHEQMRPDRDKYVTINMENVLKGQEQNFDKLRETDVDIETVPYDLLSIMHYGKLFMSKNKKANLYTIEPIDPEYLDRIGEAKSASFTDIKMVNHMYECGARCANTITCPPDGFLGKDCRCFCPSDSDGTAAVDCRDRNRCEPPDGDGPYKYVHVYTQGSWEEVDADDEKIVEYTMINVFCKGDTTDLLEGNLTCINGNWTGYLPDCISEISCGIPDVGQGIMGNPDSIRLGDIHFIYCFENATYSGDDSTGLIRCTEKGWTDGYCYANCILEEMDNGVILEARNINHDEELQWRCPENYVKPLEIRDVTCYNGTLTARPSCQHAGCSDPPLISNAYHNGSDTIATYRENDVIVYRCYGGYERWLCVCQNGNWTRVEMVCNLLSCPDPRIDRLQLSYPRTAGSYVTASCSHGYRLVGPSHLLCMVNMEWRPSLPLCTVVTCPPLHTLMYGERYQDTITHERDTHGSVVENTCRSGFLLRGGSTQTCQGDGTWSGEPAVCQVVRCPDPRIDGLHLSYPRTSGSNVRASCSYGYRLVGPSLLMCMVDLEWRPSLPSCTVMTCPPLPTLVYGERYQDTITHERDTHGTVVENTCRSGFLLRGGSTQTCQGDGTWSGEPAVCQEISCGIPDVGQGIMGSHDSIRLGDINFIYCFENATYSGDDDTGLIRCTENGWTEGYCYANCILEEMDNGVILEARTINHDEELPWRCPENYVKPLEIRDVTCYNGTLTARPYCQHVVRCPDPRIDRLHLSYPQTSGSYVTASCSKGYRLVGPSRLMCTVDMEWHPPLPSCTVVRCLDPRIDRLHLSYPRTAGSYVTASCSKGYRLVGPSRLMCTVDMEWHPSLPLCTVVRCPDPRIDRLHLSYPRTSGSYVTASCSKGYRLVGPSRLMCTVDMEWHPSLPSCTVVRCPDPRIDRLHLSYPRTSGSYVTASCSKGYRLVGPSRLMCTVDMEWHPSLPSCTVVRCPDPRIDRLHLSYPRTSGSYVTASCSKGYRLVGPSRLMCTVDMEWHPSLPSCTVVTCPPLATLMYGERYQDTFTHERDTHGSVVENRCRSGFLLRGGSTQTCQGDGTWSGEPAVCQGPSTTSSTMTSTTSTGSSTTTSTTSTTSTGSSTTTSPTSTASTGSSTTTSPTSTTSTGTSTTTSPLSTASTGSSTTTGCFENASYSGDDDTGLIRCTENGWIEGCCYANCILEEMDNGVILESRSINHNEELQWRCPENYVKPLEIRDVTCYNGTLTTRPYCQHAGCSDPPLISNAYHNGSDTIATYHENDVIVYRCYGGYERRGYSRCVCQNGNWTRVEMVCNLVSCPDPRIDRLQLSYPLTAGSYVTASCSHGYRLVGPSRLLCMVNMEWRPSIPSCTVVTCPPLPSLMYGEMYQDTFTHERDTHGSVVENRCRSGFLLRGGSTQTCQGDGTWSGEPAVCQGLEVVTCPPLPTLTYGERYQDTFTHERDTHGSVVENRCRFGFLLRGGSTQTCQGDGTWSGEPAVCQVVRCPDPGIYRLHLSYPRTAGSYVTARCANGYQLVGPSRLMCMVDMEWHPSLPSCTVVTCPPLPTLMYGERYQATFTHERDTHGSVVENRCRSGFLLRGGSTQTCQGDGTWSGEPAVCQVTRNPGNNCRSPLSGDEAYPDGDTCYYLLRYHFSSKEDAMSACHAWYSAELVTVRHQNIWNFLQTVKRQAGWGSKDVWLGLRWDDDTLKWDNGETVGRFSSTLWQEGEGGSTFYGKCAIMQGGKNWRWYAVLCSRHTSSFTNVICEGSRSSAV